MHDANLDSDASKLARCLFATISQLQRIRLTFTVMSRLSSLFTSSLLGGSSNVKDRSTDGFTKLRFSLETLPSSRRFTFTPAVRAEVLTELYDAFWGPYASFFIPSALSGIPSNTLLSHVQTRYNFHGAGTQESAGMGRSCGHIFDKGESCYRCKCVPKCQSPYY